MNRDYIIIMGGSTGAGKTTHGVLLSKRHGFLYVSSGNIARSLMDAKTDELFKQGQLSPHEDAIRDALSREISKPGTCVVDGFPRLRDQYELLKIWAEQLGKPLMLIWLMPSRTVLLNRWKLRHRDDYDEPFAANKRDELYIQETVPVLTDMHGHPDLVRSTKVLIDESDISIEDVQRVVSEYVIKQMEVQNVR